MWHPWRRVNAWFDRALDRSLEREKVLVTEGHEQRQRLWRHAYVRGAVGIAALLVMIWGPWWAEIPASGLVGFAVGLAATREPIRAGAYRSGWLDGRRRMVEQIRNHDQGEDWLRTELDHDTVHVLGLPPVPYRREP